MRQYSCCVDEIESQAETERGMALIYGLRAAGVSACSGWNQSVCCEFVLVSCFLQACQGAKTDNFPTEARGEQLNCSRQRLGHWDNKQTNIFRTSYGQTIDDMGTSIGRLGEEWTGSFESLGSFGH